MKYYWANSITWHKPEGWKVVCEGKKCQTLWQMEHNQDTSYTQALAEVQTCQYQGPEYWKKLYCAYCGRKPSED